MKRHIEQLETAIKQNEQVLSQMRAMLAEMKRANPEAEHARRFFPQEFNSKNDSPNHKGNN